MFLNVITCRRVTILSAFVVLCSILLASKFDTWYTTLNTYFAYPVNVSKSSALVLSANELAQYNGVKQKSLYIAVMGTIFDVTKGREHYQEGASYHYFVGKDGSRALVTGKFKDESNEKDHVLDLTCSELFTVLNWKKTFKKRYKEVGKLNGRYYDHSGDETSYVNEINIKIDRCEYEKELTKREEQMYPPCNIAWSQEQGTKVWCTATSGGVSRSWVGVPRQLFTPGQKKPRCVCINLNKDNSAALLKEYDNCTGTSTSCHLENS